MSKLPYIAAGLQQRNVVEQPGGVRGVLRGDVGGNPADELKHGLKLK